MKAWRALALEARPPRAHKSILQDDKKVIGSTRSKTVTVYRSETDITLFTRNDMLTGEDVVEGFSCQMAELFE